MSSIRILPAINDISLDPGENLPVEINIVNSTDGDISLDIEVRCLLSDQRCEESFLSINNQIVKLPANSTSSVLVDVGVPEDALYGGYYPSVVFVPKFETDQIGIVSEFSSLFLINVVGESNNELPFKINRFQSKDFVSINRTASFDISIENTSDAHIIPSGYIEVVDPRGIRLSSNVPINSEVRTLLPGESYETTLNWFAQNSTLTPFPGNYTAEVNISHPQQEVSLSESVSFAVIPIYIFLLFVILLMAIVALVSRRVSMIRFLGKLNYSRR